MPVEPTITVPAPTASSVAEQRAAPVPQTGPRSPVPGPTSPAEHPVIFYDGVCGLCNRWIDFVLARDHRKLFRFAPLQGETARVWLNMTADQPLNSVVLVDGTGEYRKSDAIWRMLTKLGGIWTVAGGLLRLVPRPLRNWGYAFVARHRYRLFGKKESCRMPTREERERFLP